MNLIEKKVDMLLRRLAYKIMVKDNSEIPPFTGDKNNPVEVWEYNARYGIMPVKTIEHGDGYYTHIYADGTEVNVHVTLSGIPLPEDVKKLQKVR